MSKTVEQLDAEGTAILEKFQGEVIALRDAFMAELEPWCAEVVNSDLAEFLKVALLKKAETALDEMEV